MATFELRNTDRFMDGLCEQPFATVQALAINSLCTTASFIYITSGFISFVAVYFLKLVCNLLNTVHAPTNVDLDQSAIANALANLTSNSLYMAKYWVFVAVFFLSLFFTGSVLCLLHIVENSLHKIGDLLELSFDLLLHVIHGEPIIQNRNDRKALTISRLCVIPRLFLSALHIITNCIQKILPASTILERISQYADSSLSLLEPWRTELGIREIYFPTELGNDLNEGNSGTIAVFTGKGDIVYQLSEEESYRLLHDGCCFSDEDEDEEYQKEGEDYNDEDGQGDRSDDSDKDDE
jgi:hypothetical protein